MERRTKEDQRMYGEYVYQIRRGSSGGQCTLLQEPVRNPAGDRPRWKARIDSTLSRSRKTSPNTNGENHRKMFKNYTVSTTLQVEPTDTVI